MVGFSREQSKLNAIKIKQNYARTQAKLGGADMKMNHPAWVRDAQAQNPSYTLLNKEVKEACEKKQKRQETFTRKLHEDG